MKTLTNYREVPVKHLLRKCRLLCLGAVMALSMSASVNAQTYVGNLRITTQAGIDAFNYTEVTGNLLIGPSVCCTSNIVNLDGLSELQTVGGDLRVENNSALPDLTGLGSVQTVVGILAITFNSGLTSLDGLENIQSVERLTLNDNDALSNLNGIESLQTITGDILIQRNAILENIDALMFTGVTAVASINIHTNDMLGNLDGLSGIQSVANALTIHSNPELSDCCGVYHLLTTPGALGGYYIVNNNTGCDNAGEVNTSCSAPDTDGDGIADDVDNCIDMANADQADTDGDGIGDVCDADDDNDGCADEVDVNPLVASGDLDCDGINDDCDNCPGGDDTGPCDAEVLPPFETLPSHFQCVNNQNSDKIVICKDGQTMCVSVNAANTQLANGAFLGPCTSCDEAIVANIGSGINAAASDDEFRVYPNPATSEFVVSFTTLPAGTHTLSVFDMLGRKVTTTDLKEGMSKFIIDLTPDKFNTGNYLVQLLQDGQTKTQIITVIKN